jgi:hypothetical protein
VSSIVPVTIRFYLVGDGGTWYVSMSIYVKSKPPTVTYLNYDLSYSYRRSN